MKRSPTLRLRTFAVLAVVGLAGGLAVGRPEPVAVAAPFVLVLALGLARSQDRDVEISVWSERSRAIEGEAFDLSIALESTPGLLRFDIEVDVPAGLVLEEVRAASRRSVRLAGNRLLGVTAGREQLTLRIRCEHWGDHRIGFVRARSRDALGLFNYYREVVPGVAVKVFPEMASLRTLLRPIETGFGFGDLVSRRKGEGLEFADLRPFGPGDDPRHVNWRVTARGHGMWVNDRHPERNSDVVLLVDTLAEPRRGVEVTLDLAIRATAALASGHLRRNDRVGLVTFGEPVRWLQLGMGDVQRYRILDTLMESRSRYQTYWRGVSAVPRRALPAKALIIGLSPLLDERAVAAFADLRGRGFDLAVIEIAAEVFLGHPATPEDRAARRIWELQRHMTRSRFMRRGIATVRWDPADPIHHALAEVEAFRRNAMRGRV